MNGIRPFGQTDEDVKINGVKINLNNLRNSLKELDAALENEDMIRQAKDADVSALQQALQQAAYSVGVATKRFKAPFIVNLGEAYKQYLQ